MAVAVPAQEGLPSAPQIPRITRYQSPLEPEESVEMAVLVVQEEMAVSSCTSADAFHRNAGRW